MKRLIELADASIRESIGDYYIISKMRLDNVLWVVEQGHKTIAELTETVAQQQKQIKDLSEQLLKTNRCEEEK